MRTNTHVVCEAQHNFWSAVPPSSYIFRHEALLLLLVKTAREAKIAELLAQVIGYMQN